MIRAGIRLSLFGLICLYSVFLIGAGFSRYLETDSGNILIHDIEAESFEGFQYGARLYRPLQASSLNLRPSVLFVTGDAGDRYICDHIAMEFARRGFTALTMEDFGRGRTASAPDYETENLVDAGYTFLATRSFTDHERIGLAAFYSGAEKALDAKTLNDFAASAFICPDSGLTARIPAGAPIFTALYGSAPEQQTHSGESSGIYVISDFPAGMPVNRSCISSLLEHFHTALAIPNDSPFWFDSGAQHAQLLVTLRYLLLILLFVICSGLSSLLTAGPDKKVIRFISGLAAPLLLFLVSSEIMNFFIISVRLGSPFHYLPELSVMQRNFNLPVLLCFLLSALALSVPFERGKGLRFISDIISAAGIILCLIGSLPAIFGSRSGWDVLNISGIRYGICLFTTLACLHSILLRIPASGKVPRTCSACLNGIMFYIYCCDLPAALLFRGVL